LLYTRWTSIWEALKSNIKVAQERMKKYYDRKAKEAPEIKVGDLVMLNAVNITRKRPSAKLDHKSVGPFEVLERIGGKAFRLKLPPQWKKMHDVFNVALLEPYHASTIPGRKQPPPPPDLIEGEEEYEVEEVARSRYNRRSKKVEYLTLWKGYSPADATWEPGTQFIHRDETGETALTQAVVRFHRRYPDSPIDPTVEQILKQLAA
jgi:hypothetical protein